MSKRSVVTSIMLFLSIFSGTAEAVTVKILSVVCYDTQDSDGADHVYIVADGHGKTTPRRLDQGGVWNPGLVIKDPSGPVRIALFDKESVGSDDLLGVIDIPLTSTTNGMTSIKGRKSFLLGDYHWHYEIHFSVQ